MTDPQWQRVCILCSQRGKTRRLETGHCCVTIEAEERYCEQIAGRLAQGVLL